MILKNLKWPKIVLLLAVMAATGLAIWMFSTTPLADRLRLRHVYGEVITLDDKARCLVVDISKKSDNPQIPNLRFYDTEKQCFVNFDKPDIISRVEEIRSGHYALYDQSGTQLYSLVMPYASDDIYIKMSGDIRVIDCTPYSYERQDNNSENAESPFDPLEAEKQLLEYYEENEHCAGMLMDYVRNNPETLGYDFEKINKDTEVRILTSPDKKIRFYTWDTGNGGTSPDYVAYVQYDNGKSVDLCMFHPLSDSRYVCAADVSKDAYSTYESGFINSLYQAKDKAGNSIYIANLYNKASSREGGQDAYALHIKDGKLLKIPFIDKDSNEVLSVGCRYSIPDWYFTTDGLGWSWVISFDSDTQTLYVPERGDLVMTDRYDKYRYDNGYMRYVGNDAGFWLHPSLHDFKRLCGIYQTKSKLIRIDLLADGNYRYASWDKKDAMSGVPELIITGGRTDLVENAIVFENDDCQYIVPVRRIGIDDGFDKVVIKKNGKVIQETKV